jgi:hypothetical protein
MAGRRIHEPRAVAAARRVAASSGYASLSPVVLQETNNTIVWLRPHGVIAKVGKWAHSPESLGREHRVATQLAAEGAPVAAPVADISPAVDDETGFVVTMWDQLDHDPHRDVGAADLGRSLRDLHEGLSRITESLPSFQRSFDLARPVLHDDTAMAPLPLADRSLLRDAFDGLVAEVVQRRWSERPLHGEAHDGNVLITPAGLRWVDFESVCIGPIEWDLAFLPPAAAAASSDVDAELLATLRTLNSARVATWCYARWEFEELRWHGRHHLEQVRRATVGRSERAPASAPPQLTEGPRDPNARRDPEDP